MGTSYDFGSITSAAYIDAIMSDVSSKTSALSFWTNNSGTMGERVRIDGAGNVGIGTTSPAERFVVKVAGETWDHAHFAIEDSDSTSKWDMTVGGDNKFYMGYNQGTKLVVETDGDVGIGRTDPSYPLHVGTNSTNGNGAHVTVGGVWTNGSDRHSKKNFEPVDKQLILTKVADLPITKWQYKGEPDAVRHMGPMAQDFYAAFGLGGSDKYIGTIDAEGIALAAIQGLHDIVKEKDAEIVQLKERVSKMEGLLAKLLHEQEGVEE